MIKKILLPLFAFAGLFAILWVNRAQPTAAPRDVQLAIKEFEFITEVLMGQEGSMYLYPLTRWTRAATIAVTHGNAAFKDQVTDTVSEVNRVLNGTGMSLVFIDGDADIVVEGRPLGMLWKTKDLYQCEAWGADFGFVCPTLDDATGETVKAVIGIAEDLPVQRTRSVILEELVQALGPRNDVPHFSDSLFFEPDDGDPPWDKKMSPRDKKLLRFLYLHLAPGDGSKEILAAFKKHWFSMDAGPEK